MTATDDITSPNTAISAAVQTLRERSGYSVDQLAVYAGLNRASLYRKLNGQAGWKATDVASLARFFDVTPNDLFSGQPIGGELSDDAERRVTVRHQGLEPRTRWFKHHRSTPAWVACPERAA